MESLLGLAAVVAALALPAAASAGDGYGVTTKSGCGATYGQLVSTARQAGHTEGGVNGARAWIESGRAAAHGCSV